MKDIESLTGAELEQMSVDSAVNIPEGLKDRISAGICAAELRRREHKGTFVRYEAMAAVAAIAAAVALVLSLNLRPKDTFSDPELAYAELEKTFEYISSKINPGLELASTAGTSAILIANNAINRKK